MRFLSVCSGIEAASAAWNPLGWKAAAFSEIEPFPCSVLAELYPDVPNLGDMRNHHDWKDRIGAVDLLVGGTPCQSFSVAGLRKGLDDPRGNLMLVFLSILAQFRPRWVVWENVPGVLSSTSHDAPDPVPPDPPVDMECDGAEVVTEDEYDSEELHAFHCFLAGLSELGYGLAYRVLDAQYVRVESHPGAVPQRRRRVFVVGCLGDWRRAAAVLSEREGLCGHPPPRRSPGQRSAPGLGVGSGGSCGHQYRQRGNEDAVVPELAKALRGSDGGVDREDAHTLVPVAGPLSAGSSRTGGGRLPGTDGDTAGSLLIPEVCGTLSDGAHYGGGATDRTPTPAASYLPPVAWALQERDAKGADSSTKEGHLIVVPGGGFDEPGGFTIHGSDKTQKVASRSDVACCLRGKVPFAQENSSSTVVVGTCPQPLPFDTTQITSPGNVSSPKPGDPCHPLAAGAHPPAVAFSCKDHGADAGEVAPTLRGMGHDESHANGGGQVAVAIPIQDGRSMEKGQNGLGVGEDGDPAHTLDTTGARAVAIGFPQNMSGTQCAATEEVAPAMGSHNPTAVAFKPSHFTRGKDGAPSDVFPPLSADADKGDQEAVVAFQPRIARNGRGNMGDVVGALSAQSGRTGKGDSAPCVAFSGRNRGAEPAVGRPAREPEVREENVGALDATKPWNIAHRMQVRRLIPLECERLMGLRDHYTAVRHNGKPAADGPRYCALGNSIAINELSYIGQRIALVDAIPWRA